MTLTVRISHDYGAFALDLGFAAGAGITALYGRSGAGKSSVVNAVAGLLRPAQGQIALDGVALSDSDRGLFVPPHKRRIGYVFQDARLFPHLTVAGNLAYGRRFAPRGAALPPMAHIVDLLDIGPLVDRPIAALSGGEKQRVAIGRALLSGPRMLLLDEPFAALDPARKAEILPHIERLRDEAGIPMIYVSHAMAEVARLANTIVVMDAGRILAAGPAADVLSDPDAARHIGLADAGAILTGTVTGAQADGLVAITVPGGVLHLPGPLPPAGTRLRIRIEAQDVILSRQRPEGLSALNILAATVTALRHGEGPGTMVQLGLAPDARILARITRRSAGALGLVPGTPCFAIAKSVQVARHSVARAPDPSRAEA